LPVLILTAVDDRDTKTQPLDLGATDFLPKSIDPTDLLPRIRTAELEESRQEVIQCLARAAEYRDNDTGRHVIRVGRYVGLIARELGLEVCAVELLEQAALLHDVGKIGVPDSILLKPGKLDPEEMERMQRHCGYGHRIFEGMSAEESTAYAAHTSLGARMIQQCRAPVLRLAAQIALTHHEKWDGSGYPRGLAGTAIPLEGRITAVADVFDALSSQRPYKPPFPLEKCFTILEEGRGKHFDPQILDAFFARRDEIVDVQLACADVE
jgi:putative two-component system response regulator